MTGHVAPEVDTREQASTGAPRHAHYTRARRIPGAYIEGTPLEALCGHKFVPSRDPQSLPVCPACQAIYDDNEAVVQADLGESAVQP